MNAITKYEFHGDTLDVARTDGGDVAVAFRQLCDALGVNADSQAQKLRAASWACTAIIAVQLPGDIQRRDVLFLDRRSIPMWAASINANKVRPEVRAKLIAYQRECADVLADHFLGKRGAPVSTALAAAETFAQQTGLVRDDPNLAFQVRRAIQRACNATKRSWSAVEAMVRKSTRAPGWTLIAAFNADKAIALLEAVEAGIVLVPRKPGKVRALPNAGRQTTLPFNS